MITALIILAVAIAFFWLGWKTCQMRDKRDKRTEEVPYDLEFGIDEYLPLDGKGVWVEVEVTDECGYGCKIYEHSKTGRRALAHNAVYGCTRSYNVY